MHYCGHSIVQGRWLSLRRALGAERISIQRPAGQRAALEL